MAESTRQAVVTAGHDEQPNDPSLDRVVLVDQLPSDAWVEGVVIRPCGDALVTRVDGPELFSIQSDSLSSSLNSDPAPPEIVHSFDGANCVLNICRLTGTKIEEYAVLTGYADFAGERYHSFFIWRLSFDPNDAEAPPTVSKMADAPEGSFCFGMIPLSDDKLILVDTTKHRVWRFHMATGDMSVLVDDASTMSPAKEGELFGVNRVRVAAGYLWHTNTSSGVLYRAPIEYVDDGSDIRVSGPSQVVAEGMSRADGLVMTPDGTAAYVSSYVLDVAWKVSIDPSTGQGTRAPVMEDLNTPTAMDLCYREHDEKPTLYITCCGAVGEDFVARRGAAIKGAGLDESSLKIRVTVTTEITVTYEPATAGG